MVPEENWDFIDRSAEMIGENNMQNILYNMISEEVVSQSTFTFELVEATIRCCKGVARIVVPRYEYGTKRFSSVGEPMVEFGTGWLIGKQYLITCNHVLDARSAEECERAPITKSDLNLQLQNASIEFDYVKARDSNITFGKIEKLALSVPDLDFAILKLSEPLGRVPLTISPQGINGPGEPVIIIQHPNGKVMQIAKKQNNIHSIDNDCVKYFTDTLGGSSGAPVFNEKFEVVAMHKGTIDLTVPERVILDGQIVKRINVGIRIGCIIDYLVRNQSKLWEDMNATVKQDL